VPVIKLLSGVVAVSQLNGNTPASWSMTNLPIESAGHMVQVDVGFLSAFNFVEVMALFSWHEAECVATQNEVHETRLLYPRSLVLRSAE
jgi:hypothetical protein